MTTPDGTGLFGAFMVLFGVIALVVGLFAWSSARKQLGWEPVQGTIRTSGIVFDGEFYRAQIEYAYSWRGRLFEGTRVRSLTLLTNWRGPSQRRVNKYPVGSEVTVFVDPKYPRECVLERGGDPKFLPIVLLVSAVMLIPGLSMLHVFR
jgi:hypothetical protein